MSPVPSTPDLAAGASDLDADLVTLPTPRQPWRRATLLSMVLAALGSLGFVFGLWRDTKFALRTGPPLELGELSVFRPGRAQANTWVHGEGLLHAQAVEYRRPLEREAFRLAQVVGNDRLWVQIRVSSDPSLDARHFVAPTSFVGRLVRLEEAGLRFSALRRGFEVARSRVRPDEIWLLVDGESPSNLRWVLGTVLLFVGFAGFNLLGLVRLARPVQDS